MYCAVTVSQGGWTALTWACYKGRVEVAKLLLEHGANPNTTGQVTHKQSASRQITPVYAV